MNADIKYNGITALQAGRVMKEFREKDLRYGKPMTQAQLSALIGASQFMISNLEKGKADVRDSRKYFTRIIQHLRIPPDVVRTRFGADYVITSKLQVQAVPVVLVTVLGSVQDGAVFIAHNARADHTGTPIPCPLESAAMFAAADLFAVQVTAESLLAFADLEAEGVTITPGDYVLFVDSPDRPAMKRDAVLLWFADDGIGAITVQGKTSKLRTIGGEGVPLEQPKTGAEIQGVYWGHWHIREGRTGRIK